MSLSSKRAAAVKAQEHAAAASSPAFIEACPGSGKTRIICKRVAKLLVSAPSSRKGIAVLSFTNSAVDEFASRLTPSEYRALQAIPHFLGTFDGFINQFLIQPFGIPGYGGQPHPVDSWDNLSIRIRLRHTEIIGNTKSLLQVNGISLDKFDPVTHSISPDGFGSEADQRWITDNQAALQDNAKRRIFWLHGRGLYASSCARSMAKTRLGDEAWAASYGDALRARFSEIIIDEAQDCNPDDIAILQWLHRSRIPLFIVCDPNQSIYGFRGSTPKELVRFASEMCTLIPITGNFRSTQQICDVSATLRQSSNSDTAVGIIANETDSVFLIPYSGRKVGESVGVAFKEILARNGIDIQNSIVLAHKKISASRAVGAHGEANEPGDSQIAQIASSVAVFKSESSSSRERLRAIKRVESIILEWIAKSRLQTSSRIESEELGKESRELRRAALELVHRLPNQCKGDEASIGEWIDTLRCACQELGLAEKFEQSLNKTIPRRTKEAKWAVALSPIASPSIRCDTVHQAKGHDFDAVCLVLPPDSSTHSTIEMIKAWEQRRLDEAHRVLFVGITRAKRLVALAVHEDHLDSVTNVIRASGTEPNFFGS